ncbi:sodium:alanine symporter family protein [Oscillospiraceae bacterium MB08-C2-2]|nr:sodium:alanine symporter family protein [Oscillospiraceae bacterium MB08-C2-2]
MDLLIAVKDLMWDYVLIFALCGIGIYFTIRLKFVQVRKFKESFKETFGSVTFFGKKADKEGMTSFQSLATAVAAQIGTGNLAGVATAMVLGGPGSVFWMWVSAFLGMATIYAETILAQKFKTTTADGEVVGGPAYYIRAAFHDSKFGKILANIFAILLILALGFMGNMVQANSAAAAVQVAFNIPPLVTGTMIGLLALLVFLGGVQRIVSVAEKIVPLMALFFVGASVIVIGVNYKMIIPSFQQIFVGAFAPNAIMGGALGVTIKQAVRYGIARGLFTHEAGMGSTPHAHAVAKVDHPGRQGLVAMMGVFIDTIVLLPFTVLVILTTGVLTGDHNITGIELTQNAYSAVFGHGGAVIIAICTLFFAFATIVGWYYFGLANVKYLFKSKGAVRVYSILVSVLVALGCGLDVPLVWDFADLFNGFMVLPNLVALLVLSGLVVKLMNEYESGQIPAAKKKK